MQKHSKSKSTSRSKSKSIRRPRSTRPHAPKPATSTQATALRDDSGFLAILSKRLCPESLDALGKLRRHAAGRPAHKLSGAHLLVGILFHFTVHLSGTLAEHLVVLLGIKMADSTLSQRRAALPFEVFEQLLQRILRPLASIRKRREGFYRGLRLVAIDGTSFSLPNTADVNRRCRKGGNQKGRAGFAKLNCAVLLELTLHNPLAARLGRAGESEWCLAKQLLSQLPRQCLLLADRLYGCGAFISAALTQLQQRCSHFLIRAKSSLKVRRVIKKLCDGSCIVEVGELDPKNWHRTVGLVVLRQFEVMVKRGRGKPVGVRLWTSLLDPKLYPALELARLYTQRWEQELYFRELKHQLGVNDLLKSQTVETAAQEVAAMIIATSLVAGERASLNVGQELRSRISFIKTWELLEPLWLTFSLCSDLLSDNQKQEMAERFRVAMSLLKMQKKRNRSCPRVMRQPSQAWPRKRNQQPDTGPVAITLMRPHRS